MQDPSGAGLQHMGRMHTDQGSLPEWCTWVPSKVLSTERPISPKTTVFSLPLYELRVFCAQTSQGHGSHLGGRTRSLTSTFPSQDQCLADVLSFINPGNKIVTRKNSGFDWNSSGVTDLLPFQTQMLLE